MKNTLLTLLPIIGLFLLVGCEKEAATPIAENEDLTLDYRSEKVTVCHYTGSETNPYEIIKVAKEAWINAHMAHGDAVDWDGDGYFDRESGCGEEIDCDDNDATIYPGAEEICGDGVVNNCDGSIFSSIGIIGTATPLGVWDEDIDMTNNGDGTYSILIDLTNGEVKFRADDCWDINWGSSEWPSGSASQDGPNIPVECGTYNVTFNPTTGEYTFSSDGTVSDCQPSIGIIGSATPLGWDEDIDMSDNGDGTFSISIYLTGGGEVKFRANDSWAINWGNSEWPSGFGYQDGLNIPVGSSGTYNVTFNPTTGYYNFE